MTAATWFGVALTGAGVALALLLTACAWLLVRRQFVARAMSAAEAGRQVVRAGQIAPTVSARYANARGTEWTAQLSNERLRELVATGQWREAAPWLLLAAGVVLAFPFWPFALLQIIGVPGPLAGLAAVAFLVVAFRTLRAADAPLR
jgi:hypothetical protein